MGGGQGSGGVCTCYLVFQVTDQAAEISYGFSLDLRLVKLVPLSTIVFTKKLFLNCSLRAVGTMKHLVLVVSCTTFEDTWSGKCL